MRIYEPPMAYTVGQNNLILFYESHDPKPLCRSGSLSRTVYLRRWCSCCPLWPVHGTSKPSQAADWLGVMGHRDTADVMTKSSTKLYN